MLSSQRTSQLSVCLTALLLAACSESGSGEPAGVAGSASGDPTSPSVTQGPGAGSAPAVSPTGVGATGAGATAGGTGAGGMTGTGSVAPTQDATGSASPSEASAGAAGRDSGAGGGTDVGVVGAGGQASGGAAGSSSPVASAGGAGGEGPVPDDGGSRPLGAPNALVPNPIVTHVFTADPSAYVFEGRIYVYASHDPDDQMGYDMVDYHVFSSNDLANWQDHGVVLAAADISFATKLYAPDCAYDERTNKYYLYFPDAGSAIGVAVSDSPGGPFENPVQIISNQTPGVGDVEWIFDPTTFIDDDGQAYLYFGGGPEGTGDNARVIRLNDDMVSLMDESATTIVAPDFFEASFMFKRDGRYYFSYSTTFANHPPTIDYMVSDNPMTGFEFVGTVIPNPEGNNGDNNHHSMVEYEGQWYVFYHNRVVSNRDGYSNFQRSITLDRLEWDGDGNMLPVSATRGDVQQLRSVDAFGRIEAELMAGERGIETDFAVDEGERVGVAVTDLQDGDWIAVSQVDFGDGASTLRARVASVGGGTIDVQQGGCEGFRNDGGTSIGSCRVDATGGTQSWADVDCAVEAAGGVHDLCLRFSGDGTQLMDLDYYTFE